MAQSRQAASEGTTQKSFTLTEQHGPTYRMARLCTGVAVFLGVGFAAVSALDRTAGLLTKLAIVGIFSVLVSAGVAWLLIARAERTLRVDEEGIHVSRNPRAALNLPWDALTKVEYGAMTWYPATADEALRPQKAFGPDWRTYTASGNSRRMLFPYLAIYRRRGRPIRFVERLADNVPTGSIAKALSVVEAFATDHAIPVTERPM